MIMENHENKTICDEKEDNWVVPYFVEDMIYLDILKRLPVRKVRKLRYTCKQWFILISSSHFINSHLRQSNLCLIACPRCTIVPSEGTTLSRKQMRTRYVHPDIVKINNGKVNVRDFRIKGRLFVENTCSGLVLLEDTVGNVSVSNPALGQRLKLPPCTRRGEFVSVIRGITYLDSSGEYRVVSVVFNKETGSLGCEMLVCGSSTWKWVRSHFEHLLTFYTESHLSISIKGVFYFIFYGKFEGGEYSSYMGSFDTVREKFYKSDMGQIQSRWSRLEYIHEIDGYPSVVVPNSWTRKCCQWDIWVLRDLSRGEWDKRYCLNFSELGKIFPGEWSSSFDVVATLENGRFLFFKIEADGCKSKYYIYDVQLQRLNSLVLDPDRYYIFRPHIESLVPCI